VGDRGVDCREDRCVPQTLHEWVKKAEVDSGKRGGVPTEVADR
jgi:transposase